MSAKGRGLLQSLDVGRESQGLPEGWEQPIPESIWPEALVSAVRSDVQALATPRVIETIARWRDESKSTTDPRAAELARRRLTALAAAIVDDEELSDLHIADFDVDDVTMGSEEPDQSAIGDAFTMDGYATPVPKLSVPAGLPPPLPTASWSGGARASSERLSATPQSQIGSDLSLTGFVVSDDAIVDEENASGSLFERDDTGPPRPPKGHPQFYRAARVDPFSEEDDKPTASIPMPEQIRQHAKKDDTQRAPIPLRPPDGSVAADEDTVGFDEKSKAVDPMPIASDDFDDDQTAAPNSRLAPKPGIVSRNPATRHDSPLKPRAAMAQVRALYTLLLPLCEELIPLSPERRARRFWARWREAASEHGVRREFVEELLERARDVRSLVSELIAETQSVNVKSVLALIDKIDAQNKTPSVAISGPKKDAGA